MTRQRDLEPIIVGVDGSPCSRLALEWAAEQARLSGRPLSVVTVWHFPRTYGWSPAESETYHPNADLNVMLENLVTEVIGEEPGITVVTEVLSGHPATTLIELSKRASLVVIGSRGHGEFVGMMLGSVGLHVVSHSRCPVVVVRDGRTDSA
jgi:nucleotide-binding universal stress UspA family protein